MPDVTRIIEQKATESIYNDDWALIDRPTEGEDGGTRKILVSRLKELLCGDYIADEWVAGETYTNGAIVSHEGKLYYNKSGGTLVHTTFNSNSWLEVKIDELLEKVISSVGEKWRRVDTYHYDDLVVYGGRLYRCIKNASTQGTWVSNEWIEANAEYYFKKVREYIARYGFVPSGEAIPSPYNKGDLILYRAPGDTTNSLYMRLNDTEHGDPTWIPENWLKVENIGGALSKIYDDMEESSCDVQIKEQSIVDENNVADLTSLAAVGSASGAIATFDDGSDLPMPKLEVAIEPQQDLHGYDAPWVGGAGKNKYSGGNVTVNNTLFASVDVSPIPSGTYTISALLSNEITNDVRVAFRKADGSPINETGLIYNASGRSTGTITTDTVAEKIYFYYGDSTSGTGTRTYTKIQIELGSTATTYEPYSNICPISGHNGVNAWVRGKNLVNWKWNAFNDGKMEIFLKGGTYTLSAESTLANGNAYIRGTKPSGEYVSREELGLIDWGASSTNGVYYGGGGQQTYTFNVPNGGAKIEFGKLNNNGTINAQLELGTTATTYEPYNGQTYTLDLDGTRYGGKLDVVSGVLTDKKGMVDLGSLDWNYTKSIFVATLPSNSYKYASSVKASSDIYSFVGTVLNGTVDMQDKEDGSFAFYYNTNYPTSRVIYVKNSAYMDATAFKSAMSGHQVLYELATPQTYQLTPTQVKSLLGVNNIWADTGDILDAEYIRDMTTIINSLIARIEALEN